MLSSKNFGAVKRGEPCWAPLDGLLIVDDLVHCSLSLLASYHYSTMHNFAPQKLVGEQHRALQRTRPS